MSNFRYTPVVIPNTIVVVGGGGTGSRLVPMLTQFMRSITQGLSPRGWVVDPHIILIDPDIVEGKNLLRQNFAPSDINKNKAVVLAERYSRAYEIPVIPVQRYVGADNMSTNLILEDIRAYMEFKQGKPVKVATVQGMLANAMVISCVDSAKARRCILEMFVNMQAAVLPPERMVYPLFIDSGNEDNFGQVNFFNAIGMHSKTSSLATNVVTSIPKMCGDVCDINFLPMDVAYYANMVDTPAQGSCADLDQTLAINALMATNIMAVVKNYFFRKPFTYNCVRVSLDGGNMTDLNTMPTFKRMAMDLDARRSDNLITAELRDNHKFDVGDYKLRVTEKGETSPTAYNWTYQAICRVGLTFADFVVPLAQVVTAREKEEARLRKLEEDRLRVIEYDRLRAEEQKRLEAIETQRLETERLVKQARLKAKLKAKRLAQAGLTPGVPLAVLTPVIPVPVSIPAEIPTLTPIGLARRTRATHAAQSVSMESIPPLTQLRGATVEEADFSDPTE